MNQKKIFITGGAGYVGCRLIPFLLEKNFKIIVYDVMFFTSKFLPHHKNLEVVEGDIRDLKKVDSYTKNCDYFLHLACISNDNSFVLDEELSTSINLNAFEPLVKIAKKNGVKRFIYASTSSVYGISETKNINEDHPLVPITLYNKYKGMCEPLLFQHTDDSFEGVVFRPATVCGYSPRQRLDLSVNILTNLAINNQKITVFGGDQLRPNLHILDYCDLVLLLLNSKTNLISNQVFNVGYENLKIIDIAKKVKKTVEKNYPELKNIEIIRTESDDKRSYHIHSGKIFDVLSFKPKRSIEDAIEELCNAFKTNLIKKPYDNDIYYNVERLKKKYEKK